MNDACGSGSTIANTILSNAITSISIGVEDFKQGSNARKLSALRNIFSGILLLYKEKLRCLSPPGSDEVLVKAAIAIRFDKNGCLIFEGSGKKTVDVAEIERRFNSLGIKTDWVRLRKIQRIRNTLEHYQLDGDVNVLVESINDCFILIRDFLYSELSIDPLVVFDSDIWQEFLENEEVFEREYASVRTSRESSRLPPKIKLFFDSVECQHCGSELIEISDCRDIYEVVGHCRVCGTENHGPVLLERAIRIATGFEDYRSVKHGGETVFGVCPSCGHRTFCNGESICYTCEYEIEYEKCVQCGCSLSLDEQDLNGFCSYCNHINEKMMKDD
jgi:hypothetical protein